MKWTIPQLKDISQSTGLKNRKTLAADCVSGSIPENNCTDGNHATSTTCNNGIEATDCNIGSSALAGCFNGDAASGGCSPGVGGPV